VRERARAHVQVRLCVCARVCVVVHVGASEIIIMETACICQ